jgi:hypothetical protein
MTTATTNPRNRIEASKKAPGYNERCFVDAPTHELEAMLADNDKLYAALMDVTQALQVICKSPYCVTTNQAAFAKRAAAAKAVLDALA